MNNNKFLKSIQSSLGADFNLGLLISIIKKSLVWIILLLFIAALSVILYLRYTNPVYEASTSMMLKTQKTTKLLGADNEFLTSDKNEIFREIQLMKSTIITSKVVEELDLGISYYKKGRTKLISSELYPSPPFIFEGEVLNENLYNKQINIVFKDSVNFILNYILGEKNYSIQSSFGDSIENKDFKGRITKSRYSESNNFFDGDYFFIINNKQHSAQKIAEKTTVTQINPSTRTLEIYFQDENKHKAKDVINKISEVFRQYDLETKQASANSILRFLDVQIKHFTDELNKYQDSLKDFRLENNFLSPEDEAENIIESLRQLEKQKDLLSYDLEIIDWYVNYIDKLHDLKVISPGLLEVQLSSSINYVNTLIELEKEKEALLRKTTSEHPRAQLLEKEINDVKFNLNQELSNNVKRLELKMNNVNKNYNQEFSKFFELPEKEAEFERLNRKFKINETYYLNLLDKQVEISIAKAGIVSDYIVLESGNLPGKPIGLDPSLIWISSLTIALLAGLLLIMLRYVLHNTIVSIEQIRANTTANILGVVPSLKGEDLLSPVIVHAKPKSQIAESFRTIRSNLQFLTNSGGCKKIAISSTISGEGKTFIALNIAGILSQLGKKVILVDMDMRRPRLNSIFEIPNENGLSTILAGRDTLEDCLFEYDAANLDIITSGPIPPNPAELLLSDNFNTLITRLESEYDYIVFDTPPVGLVTDGLEIIKWVDYPIYVFRADYSEKDFVFNLQKLIDENKIEKLSIVLNDIGRRDSAYSYSYGYGYGYGYGAGSGYYVENTHEKKSIFKRLFG